MILNFFDEVNNRRKDKIGNTLVSSSDSNIRREMQRMVDFNEKVHMQLLRRINNLENAITKITYEQAMNSEFRIKWPRGEMGSLPDDARQDMRIEALTNKLEDMRGLDKELEVVRMRVGAIEDFANRPSRSAEHIKQVEIKIDFLTKELERLRQRYNK